MNGLGAKYKNSFIKYGTYTVANYDIYTQMS